MNNARSLISIGFASIFALLPVSNNSFNPLCLKLAIIEKVLFFF